VRRIEPAYPDLFPLSHTVRPGYLPGPRVTLDPIRMGVVWDDAPQRVLPGHDSIARLPVRAIVFGRVAAQRPTVIPRLLERGSAVVVVLDDPSLGPDDVGLGDVPADATAIAVLPVLPSPLSEGLRPPEAWRERRWGAVLGLFPFPGAGPEVERRIEQLKTAGATFAVAAPLLLTPKDRHRILDGCEGTGLEDRLENCLFHADVSRGLHALERRTGVTLDTFAMEPVLSCLVPRGYNGNAVRTAALMRLWARRLDQSHEESSWGWRLRRAAAALEPLHQDPATLALEDNLRVVPGFDPWVESFTRALWYGGEPVESAWRRWSGVDGAKAPHPSKPS
jgi:hypothetical protein